MTCPRCEQGEIKKAIIKKTKVQIYICDECDAIWFSQDKLGDSDFLDFGKYLQSLELPPLWKELSVLSEDF